MDAEIKAEFEKGGFILVQEDQILPKCLTYCINYKLSPSDLVANWEIYYLNRQINGLKIETSYMDGFLSHLQNDQKEKIMKEEPNLHVYSSDDIGMLNSDVQDDVKEGSFDTPNHLNDWSSLEFNETSKSATSEKPSSSKRLELNFCMTPFGQRMNKFLPQFTFNDHIAESFMNNQESQIMDNDDVIRRVQPREACSLHIHQSLPQPGCRFMFDRIEDQFNLLESRIEKHSKEFATSGLYGEPTDATLASQKNIFAVGMICCDGEGRLNEKSIMLQGSVEHSGGQRVRIDVQKLHQFSLFPGQVVGLEGHNPSGHCLMASRVVENMLLAPDSSLPSAKKQAIDHEQKSSPISASKVVSMVIAAVAGLCSVYGFFCSVVLVVPSIRDAHHDFVFPQPAFDVEISDITQHQISCLGNPCLFSSNEILVGCSTVDILKHLSSEEISRGSVDATADRIGRLAMHLLSQHNYYPLYPPSMGVPLDLSLAPEALDISSIPELLLLPSDLAPFVKVLSYQNGDEKGKGCMCVNPGRLAKGIGGGTFVELNYLKDPDNSYASIIRI
ncbi:hypothetical protein HPP92_024300 [Vanilla planifolia]|uniref:DNA polymerase alpha subunit B n=1 Tax=Vanilla planifolia TaxID=51239 RepID=A0A835PLQ6_VANPL|nr:hypothetical protein HPP92_024300 [Vanilla planifolia]